MTARRFLPLALLAACASTPEPVPEPPVPERGVHGAAVPPAVGSLWNQDPQSLFGNRRAREVGDILTVIVEIDEEAEIMGELETARTSQRSLGIRSLFGGPEAVAGQLPGGAGLDPAIDLDSAQARSGGGSLRREDRVTLRLAARVIERLPNGDLVIDGHQSVRVNYEERTLRAAGIVRPEDISRSNTVTHDKIAEAQIGYVGRGVIDRSIRPRLGDRLLDALTPF
ncbi:flagellar basal body L-ring protein FlgH [Parvularcula dongshanensis]|uniref:Flagellar L-ring protein n=1 Tax=Parvularcula dongshanensis TaxID=1173995 RepID=A0A840I8M9_9PROT|nr:flagellar basal body L-ring protein FlgH [Parvularcula dongshanensis]MBB4660310.1 flagellar L-ring protein precursor FlgH [Parvularcula dongshanensis]